MNKIHIRHVILLPVIINRIHADCEGLLFVSRKSNIKLFKFICLWEDISEKKKLVASSEEARKIKAMSVRLTE